MINKSAGYLSYLVGSLSGLFDTGVGRIVLCYACLRPRAYDFSYRLRPGVKRSAEGGKEICQNGLFRCFWIYEWRLRSLRMLWKESKWRPNGFRSYIISRFFTKSKFTKIYGRKTEVRSFDILLVYNLQALSLTRNKRVYNLNISIWSRFNQFENIE